MKDDLTLVRTLTCRECGQKITTFYYASEGSVRVEYEEDCGSLDYCISENINPFPELRNEQ